jgi:hypothetical protein
MPFKFGDCMGSLYDSHAQTEYLPVWEKCDAPKGVSLFRLGDRKYPGRDYLFPDAVPLAVEASIHVLPARYVHSVYWFAPTLQPGHQVYAEIIGEPGGTWYTLAQE